MNILSVDIGTTLIKCALVGTDGFTSIISGEYSTRTEGKISEQDAHAWWTTVVKCIKELLAMNPKATVEAICVGSQGITFVPVDRKGEPLCSAITWIDGRAETQVLQIQDKLAQERIFSITGKHCLPCYNLPKLLWLKENANSIYKQAYRFLFPADYLNYRMTGCFMTDYTMASGSMLFDVNRKCWSEELAELFDIDIGKFPDVKKFGSKVGVLCGEAARELKLPQGIPVFLGGQDQKLAAIGAGIGAETATVSLGTATAVCTLALNPVKKCSVFAFDGVSPFYECVLDTSGATIRWLCNLLGFESYAQMDALAEQTQSNGGVFFDPNFVSGGKIENLNLGTQRGHLVCALYKSIAEAVADMIPDAVREIVLFGGGAKSAPLCKAVAQALKKPVFVSDTVETAVLGGAILASDGKIKAAGRKRIYA